jgi:alkylation response protein AidB-like acyl-CoA dehydrogenase
MILHSETAIRATIEKFARRYAPEEAIDAAWASGTLYDPGIHRALADEGLIGATWPVSLGGRALDPVSVGWLWEAMNYHRLPIDLLELTEMVAHVIVKVGTEGQKARVLPRVRSGDMLISLGYTEPGAGSDVAASATRAVRDGDGWTINGSKIFTTGGHVADLIFVLARTDADAAKHRGLSLFLVPRDATGVEVQPIRTFGGERTNTVFFTDVVVDADALVGAVNDGWSVLNLALDFERQVMGAYAGQARRLFDDLMRALGPRLRDPVVTHELSRMSVRLEEARTLAEDVGRRAAAGLPIDVAAAMAKLAVTETLKDLSHLALDLVGPASLLSASHDGDPGAGRLEHWFRHAQVTTIYGGSNEIQRTIIAGGGGGRGVWLCGAPPPPTTHPSSGQLPDDAVGVALRMSGSTFAPSTITASRATSLPWLCQRCEVPFWMRVSPRRRTVRSPESSSSVTSPWSTSTRSTVSVACSPGPSPVDLGTSRKMPKRCPPGAGIGASVSSAGTVPPMSRGPSAPHRWWKPLPEAL